MSTYELDDDVVRAFLTGPNPVASESEAALVRALEDQLPPLVDWADLTLGAVVMTRDGASWVLCEPGSEAPWRSTEGRWVDAEDLDKRVVKRVLSSGVDL